MSIFGKKAEPAPATAPSAPSTAPVPAPVAPAASAAPAAPVAAAPNAAARGSWGIDQAIVLMRTLPFGSNADLVALVVKSTLSSMDISVQDVIAEAIERQETIKARMTSMQAAIADLERQLVTRREEMAAADSEMAEATATRKRLELVANQEPAGPRVPAKTGPRSVTSGDNPQTEPPGMPPGQTPRPSAPVGKHSIG